MVATLAAAPVVSLFAACTYCPVLTSFSCLNCGTAMCPDCCPSDFCPDCLPDPVAPLVALGGWSFADEGIDDDAVAVACAGCGDQFFTDDAEEFCPRCAMPATEFAALRMVATVRPTCQTCGATLYGSDGPRCTTCTRFITHLDAKHAAWKEERLAA